VSTRGARILVFDDSDDDLELLRLSFARHAPRCLVTGVSDRSNAEGILFDSARRPDLVLLDWKMPGIDCPGFLRAIRREPRTVGVPVVVFSSSDDPRDVCHAFDAGATAYLLKPRGIVDYDTFVTDLNGFWCRMALYPP
jgi:two-component system response regulator